MPDQTRTPETTAETTSDFTVTSRFVRPAVAVFDDELPPEAEHLFSPVLCTHCGAVYEYGGVEVVHNHADCTVFKTPCCGRTVDDRRFKSIPDFTRINPNKKQGPFLAEFEQDDLMYPPSRETTDA